jgi:hypothetical protein
LSKSKNGTKFLNWTGIRSRNICEWGCGLFIVVRSTRMSSIVWTLI